MKNGEVFRTLLGPLADRAEKLIEAALPIHARYQMEMLTGGTPRATLADIAVYDGWDRADILAVCGAAAIMCRPGSETLLFLSQYALRRMEGLEGAFAPDASERPQVFAAPGSNALN